MKVIKAEKMGFCFGVKRAIEKVEQALKEEKKVYTFGALIHNNQFVEKMKKEGVEIVENEKEIKPGMTVIVRAHGLPPKTMKEIEKKGAAIIDATCPKVLNIQRLAKRFESNGKNVIIIGNSSHPEIIGIMGNLETGIVVREPEEVDRLPDNFEEIAVVSQTTEEQERFEKIVGILSKKFKNIEIYNTICEATKERQDGAKKTTKEADAMIVLGGKHSSNTTHIANICGQLVKTFHFETADEIDGLDLKGVSKIGITAGASTPDYLIEEAVQKLNQI